MIPRWFAALLLACVGAVIGAGLVGLGLAVAGTWTLAPTVAAGAVVGIGGGVVGAIAPAPPERGRRFRSHAGAVLAVAGAVGFVVANWFVVGESPLLERDPGLYTSTARWLDREGTLTVDARVGPFAETEGLEFVSVGMYDLDGTTLEFQANHLTPVLLAVGYGFAESEGMHRVCLILVGLGLLAVYALAVRVSGRIWAGLAVMVAIGASMPVLAVARDSLSEAVLLPVLWAGLWLWTVAADRGRGLAAVAAGVCLGACVATRIDAAALFVPLPIALAARRCARPELPSGLGLKLLLGALPGLAVGLTDLGLRSRGYLADLEVEVALSAGLLAVATSFGLLLVALRSRLLTIGQTGRTWLGWTAGVALAAALLLAWFVRPEVQEVRADYSTFLRGIQRAEGNEVDPARRYHELSVVWQAWYLGPIVVAGAIAGAAVVVRKVARATDRSLLLPLSVLGAGTLLYLVRPAISPDHVWASRRFVPTAIPLFAVLATVALVAGVERIRQHWVRGVIVVQAVVAALVPIGMRLGPVPAFREQAGFGEFVDESCELVDGGAVVIPELTRAGQALAQTLRSWCDVPVALVADLTIDVDEIDVLAAAWAAQGRELWVVADTRDQVSRYTRARAISELGPVETDRALEKTLEDPPSNYATFELSAHAARAARG